MRQLIHIGKKSFKERIFFLFLGIYLKEQLDKRAKTYVKTIHYKIDYISRKVKIRKVKSRKSKRF